MKAQSTIEFTFAMIVIMFLLYGMIQVLRWTGIDLAQRRYLQDSSLTAQPSGDPSSQLTADTRSATPMSVVYRGAITTGNSAQ